MEYEDWNKDYKLVWVTNWWDWELEGVCRKKADGKRFFFECIDQPDGWNRIFAIYDLPENIWKEIDQRHKDFQTYVGTHWDFEVDENGRTGREKHELKPYTEHYKFYDKYKDKKITMKEEWKTSVAKTYFPIPTDD